MVTINISNRGIYTFIAVIVVALLAVGVYAVVPNPGHSSTEVDFVEGSIPLEAIDTDLCESDGTNCQLKAITFSGTSPASFGTGSCDFSISIGQGLDPTKIVDVSVYILPSDDWISVESVPEAYGVSSTRSITFDTDPTSGYFCINLEPSGSSGLYFENKPYHGVVQYYE